MTVVKRVDYSNLLNISGAISSTPTFDINSLDLSSPIKIQLMEPYSKYFTHGLVYLCKISGRRKVNLAGGNQKAHDDKIIRNMLLSRYMAQVGLWKGNAEYPDPDRWIDPFLEVDHIDEDSTNDCILNLDFLTRTENKYKNMMSRSPMFYRIVCPVCGIVFEADKNRIVIAERIRQKAPACCSYSCANTLMINRCLSQAATEWFTSNQIISKHVFCRLEPTWYATRYQKGKNLVYGPTTVLDGYRGIQDTRRYLPKEMLDEDPFAAITPEEADDLNILKILHVYVFRDGNYIDVEEELQMSSNSLLVLLRKSNIPTQQKINHYRDSREVHRLQSEGLWISAICRATSFTYLKVIAHLSEKNYVWNYKFDNHLDYYKKYEQSLSNTFGVNAVQTFLQRKGSIRKTYKQMRFQNTV